MATAKDIATGALTQAMKGLTDQIKSTMDFAQRAEKASLALGMTFDQTNDKLGGTMQGLRGDLNQRFAASVAGLEVGLQGNTKGLARLINQQRLTGTASAGTAKAMATLQAQLGLSDDKSNEFANSIVETGAKWGISTDKIVNAVKALEDTMPSQAMAGMGDKIEGAVRSLTAELPQGMSGSLNKVMHMILDTSLEGMQKLTMLGLGGVREQLSASKSSEQAAQILRESFKTASAKFSEIGGGAEDFYALLGVAADTFGRNSIEFTVLAKGLGVRTQKAEEATADFGNQLAVIGGEILLPLSEALVEFQPILIATAQIMGDLLGSAVSYLVERAKALYVHFGGLGGIVDTIKGVFTSVKEGIQDNMGKIKLVLGTVGLYLVGALTVFTAGLVASATWMALVTVGFIALTSPLILLGAAVVGLGAAVVGIIAIFKNWGKITGWLSDGFDKFKNMIGNILLKFDGLPLIGGFLGDFADSLKSSTEAVATNTEMREVELTRQMGIQLAEENKARNIAKMEREGNKDNPDRVKLRDYKDTLDMQNRNLERLRNMTDEQYKIANQSEKTQKKALAQDVKTAEKANMSFKERMALDKERFSSTKKSEKDLAEINAKTPEIKTNPEFLDQTANMLGRSIESILGITKDNSAAEIVEELRALNEQTAVLVEKPDPEGAPATAS
jgi:hypothetical protein